MGQVWTKTTSQVGLDKNLKQIGGQTMRQTSGTATPNTNPGNVSGYLYGSRTVSPGLEFWVPGLGKRDTA